MGYALHEHYIVGSYAIPMVVRGARAKAAIVCDGERWGLTAAVAAEEQRREAVLERLGWTFFHLRGSAYYKDAEGTMERLAEEFAAIGIAPRAEEEAESASETDAREALSARVRARAEEILAAWHAPQEEE